MGADAVISHLDDLKSKVKNSGFSSAKKSPYTGIEQHHSSESRQIDIYFRIFANIQWLAL